MVFYIRTMITMYIFILIMLDLLAQGCSGHISMKLSRSSLLTLPSMQPSRLIETQVYDRLVLDEPSLMV